MDEITPVGLAPAKHVVLPCGEDGAGWVVVQRTLQGELVPGWFAHRPAYVGRTGSRRYDVPCPSPPTDRRVHARIGSRPQVRMTP